MSTWGWFEAVSRPGTKISHVERDEIGWTSPRGERRRGQDGRVPRPDHVRRVNHARSSDAQLWLRMQLHFVAPQSGQVTTRICFSMVGGLNSPVIRPFHSGQVLWATRRASCARHCSTSIASPASWSAVSGLRQGERTKSNSNRLPIPDGLPFGARGWNSSCAQTRGSFDARHSAARGLR